MEAKFAFGAQDSVWLCLTTLRHRRFAEDLVHLIGLPAGSHVRLRYRRPYVASETWDMVSSNFVPKEVHILVALAGTDSASKNQVIPVRLGQLGSASCEGSVMVLDVVLGEFPKELYPAGMFWKELEDTAVNLPSGFDASAPSNGSYLQQLSNPPRTIAADGSIEAWEATANLFFQLDDMASSDGSPYAPFLYYISGTPERVRKSLAETGALIVEAGSTLSLQVHTITRRSQGIIHNPLGEVQVDLSHGSAQLASSRRVRVDSLRDVKSIRIATNALFRRTYGHLSVRKVAFRYEDATAGEGVAARTTQSAERREEVVVARYDYPLRVGRWRPWLASGMVALAAAIAVFESPEDGKLAWTALMLPTCAFFLAFFGLALGLRREGGS